MRYLLLILTVSLAWSLSGCMQKLKKNLLLQFADSTLVQNGLVEIVKSIEIFKVRNHAYPDSLPELLAYEPQLSLTEPLTGRSFYYKKIGAKYALFSAGPDTLPGTPDDIYPLINFPDSSRVGLIKEH
jgi:hypothetical protein